MTEDSTTNTKKNFSIDWLIQGVLTKLGDIFDTFTGRRWKPSSSLATSELIEKLKMLLDTKAQEQENKGKFVPHIIQMKMQWDKFSTDAGDSLKKLENELLIAAVDHINDNRYHTYAPLKIDVKPDYFTEGVKLQASFGSDDEMDSAAAINVTVPDLKNVVIAAETEMTPETDAEIYTAKFTIKEKQRETKLSFKKGQRRTVGRSGENDLWLDDASISKIHAALIINGEGQLIMSDTGSTNGTFINEERIPYGKAIPVKPDDKVKFGLINVELTRVPNETDNEDQTGAAETEFEMAESEIPKQIPAKTIESSKQIPLAKTITIKPEAEVTAVLLKEDFSAEKESSPKIEMPKEMPFDENDFENQAQKYETSVDEKSSDKTNSPTEQGIVFDFDEK